MFVSRECLFIYLFLFLSWKSRTFFLWKSEKHIFRIFTKEKHIFVKIWIKISDIFDPVGLDWMRAWQIYDIVTKPLIVRASNPKTEPLQNRTTKNRKFPRFSFSLFFRFSRFFFSWRSRKCFFRENPKKNVFQIFTNKYVHDFHDFFQIFTIFFKPIKILMETKKTKYWYSDLKFVTNAFNICHITQFTQACSL